MCFSSICLHSILFAFYSEEMMMILPKKTKQKQTIIGIADGCL